MDSAVELDVLSDTIENPFQYETKKQYSLSVIRKKDQPYTSHIILSPDSYELGTLNLRQGDAPFTVIQDGTPVAIVSGLEKVCSSLLDIINQDNKWVEADSKILAVQDTCTFAERLAKKGELYEGEDCKFQKGLKLLGYNEKDFVALSSDWRANVEKSYTDPLSTIVMEETTLSIRGIGYFRNIRFNNDKVFTQRYPWYSSFTEDSKVFKQCLENCLELVRLENGRTR